MFKTYVNVVDGPYGLVNRPKFVKTLSIPTEWEVMSSLSVGTYFPRVWCSSYPELRSAWVADVQYRISYLTSP